MKSKTWSQQGITYRLIDRETDTVTAAYALRPPQRFLVLQRRRQGWRAIVRHLSVWQDLRDEEVTVGLARSSLLAHCRESLGLAVTVV